MNAVNMWKKDKMIHLLTLPVPIPGNVKKSILKSKFYFLTSLWCFKGFYEGL